MKNLHEAIVTGSLVALNLVLGKVAASLSLPVYLDTIGTILAGAILPLPYAIATGAMTSLAGGIVIHPVYPFFIITQSIVALMAAALVRKGMLKTLVRSILSGVILAISAAIVSAPVTVLLFGGVTLSGTTFINGVLLASGINIWKSVVGGSLLIESLDKIAATSIAYIVLKRLPAVSLNANLK